VTPNEIKETEVQVLNPQSSPAAPKLSLQAHLVCGWPLILVIIGGLIGGGLGGAAYAVNLQIYKSQLPIYGKIALNISTGLIAGFLWLLIVVVISSQMQ
jgi:hypothetical protein